MRGYNSNIHRDLNGNVLRVFNTIHNRHHKRYQLSFKHWVKYRFHVSNFNCIDFANKLRHIKSNHHADENCGHNSQFHAEFDRFHKCNILANNDGFDNVYNNGINLC